MSRRIFLQNIFINHLSEKKYIEIDDLPGIEVGNSIAEEFNDFKLDKLNNDHACWCCGLYFDGEVFIIPIFMTTDITENKNNEYAIYKNSIDSDNYIETQIVKSFGNFCSILCANRFLLETIELPASCKKNYTQLLYYHYRKLLGGRVSFLPPAHPKFKMKKYGGEWTEEEFVKNNKILLNNYLKL